MKIIKGMPIPEKRQHPSEYVKIASKMQVDDCVICDDFKASQGLYRALRGTNKNPVTRRLPDGKYGVWVI
jgi:hypothetical protein